MICNKIANLEFIIQRNLLTLSKLTYISKSKMNYKHLFSYISTFCQGSFRIYEITEEEHKKAEKEHPALLFRNLPSNDVEKVIVRLYVIAVRSLLCFISLLRPCLDLVIDLCCPLAQYFHTDILHLHGNFSVYESKVFFYLFEMLFIGLFLSGD